MSKWLNKAIDGTYAPRGAWSQEEFDIAFLAKALSGTRLLYVFQKAEGFPSETTLLRKRPIPELVVSIGPPTAPELNENIESFLGKTGRKPAQNPIIGQILMIDGVALEEVCRYDHRRGVILGVCREHTSTAPVLEVHTLNDIHKISESLHEKKCHHGKDGTVIALASITGDENYFPVPLVLSPSCKAETGDQLSIWISHFLDIYRVHPSGEKLHGPIRTLATDGEATFRFLRFLLGLVEDLDCESDLEKLLYQLPGFNCVVGRHGLLTTCDPKHIIKRFATMIRSSLGILIGNTALHFDDFLFTLTLMDKLSDKQACELLNPADKQNVPKAVNLIQTLNEQSDLTPDDANPTRLSRLNRVNLFAIILSKFLLPFVDVNMTLSQQIKSLSIYSHLITALYRKHRTSFMNSVLFADSQSIVKNIIFTVARYQILDKSIKYYVILEGTDRLEGVFSNARTQDHAHNFDILQLAHKLSVGAEINAIFERNPKLDRGHVRRNLHGARGVDHVNPKSWKGDVTVGNVDLLKEYLEACDEADSILQSYLQKNEQDIIVDWPTLFANPKIDHLRPLGTYVGSRAADEASTAEEGTAADDNDDEELISALLNMSQRFNSTTADLGNEPYHDTPPQDDANHGLDPVDNLNDSDGILNPALSQMYIEVEGGRKRHIDALVAEYLTAERARKSITRTLRVKDITVEESIRRIEKLNIPDISNEDTDIVKSGDLGAFLVRLPQNVICVAVGEVLNFRGASSRKLVGSAKVEDLEVESGPNALTVAIQVLDLTANVAGQNITWNWTKEYIQTKENQQGFTTQTQCVTRIPGFNFFPITAGIDIGADNRPVWSIRNEDLRAILDVAWESLHPTTDEIITNLEYLPQFFPINAQLPYKLPSGARQLLVADPPVQLAAKLDPTQEIACKLCGETKILVSKMRDHVGAHILRALRIRGMDIDEGDYAPHPADITQVSTILIRDAQ